MSGERLLEKLERWEKDPCRRGGKDQPSIESVLCHLRRLLNTKQGNAPIAADFGTPDLLSCLQSFPRSVAAMEDAILRAIEKYEPRLRDVQVLFQRDQEETLVLRFEIRATVVHNPVRRLSFESSIDVHGKVRISGHEVCP